MEYSLQGGQWQLKRFQVRLPQLSPQLSRHGTANADDVHMFAGMWSVDDLLLV